MAGRPVYYDRNGNIKKSPREFDIPDSVETVYQIPDVIDLIFLGKDNKTFSVDPKAFIQNTNNNNQSFRTTNYAPKCDGDSDAPISTSRYSRDTAKTISYYAVQYGGGAYHENGDKKAIKNIWTDYDMELSRLLDSGNAKINMNWECTEFVRLYYSASTLTQIMNEGYQLFSPEDYLHPHNWFRYDGNGDHNNYCIVLYLTKQRFLLERSCFNEPTSKTLDYLKSKVGSDAVYSFAAESCSASASKYPHWAERVSPSTLFCGQAIYSPLGKYKLIMQLDGNLVIYEISSRQAIWALGTANPRTCFGYCEIQSDGKVVLYTKEKSEFYTLATTGNGGCVLRIDDYGTIAIFKLGTDKKTPVYKNGSNDFKYEPSVFANHCVGTIQGDNNNHIIAAAQADYCLNELYMISNPNCGKFRTVIEHDKDNVIKNKIDSVVLKRICNNFDKNNPEIVKFCSCVAPIGDALKILNDLKIDPKCWDVNCSNSGYQVKGHSTDSCLKYACIQNQNMTGGVKATDIKQKCSINLGSVTNNSSSSKTDINNDIPDDDEKTEKDNPTDGDSDEDKKWWENNTVIALIAFLSMLILILLGIFLLRRTKSANVQSNSYYEMVNTPYMYQNGY